MSRYVKWTDLEMKEFHSCQELCGVKLNAVDVPFSHFVNELKEVAVAGVCHCKEHLFRILKITEKETNVD